MWHWLLAAGVAGLSGVALAAPPAVHRDPVTGTEFVALPKGCYRMGSDAGVQPKDDYHWKHLGFVGPLDADERPPHEVCVDAFWIGRTEVTAVLWQRVYGKAPPAGQGEQPAGGMSWDEAQRFIARLNALSPSKAFRLPTEAEWEYACRAGRSADFEPKMGEEVAEAWFSMSDRRLDEASDVAQLDANPWGLFDMLGNVWEWTADTYQPDAYSRHALYNPREARAGSRRTIRGGSFRSEYLNIRCANRGRYPQSVALPQIGLRLVREP